MNPMCVHIPADMYTHIPRIIPLRLYFVAILTVFRLGSGAALSPNVSPCAFDKSSNQTVETWVSTEPFTATPTPLRHLTSLSLDSLVLTQKFLGRKDYRPVTFAGSWQLSLLPRLESFRLVEVNRSNHYYSLIKSFTTCKICDFVHITARIWNATHAFVHIQDEIIRVIPIGIQK